MIWASRNSISRSRNRSSAVQEPSASCSPVASISAPALPGIASHATDRSDQNGQLVRLSNRQLAALLQPSPNCSRPYHDSLDSYHSPQSAPCLWQQESRNRPDTCRMSRHPDHRPASPSHIQLQATSVPCLASNDTVSDLSTDWDAPVSRRLQYLSVRSQSLLQPNTCKRLVQSGLWRG